MTKLNSKNIAREAKAEDLLFRKCFVFVLDVIEYNEILEKRNKHNVAKRLLKSATEFGSLINDAKYSENQDVVSEKSKKAVQEAQKTKYLLLLCKYSNTYPNPYKLISNIDLLIKNISQTITN
jgi:hypothetical protein